MLSSVRETANIPQVTSQGAAAGHDPHRNRAPGTSESRVSSMLRHSCPAAQTPIQYTDPRRIRVHVQRATPHLPWRTISRLAADAGRSEATLQSCCTTRERGQARLHQYATGFFLAGIGRMRRLGPGKSRKELIEDGFFRLSRPGKRMAWNVRKLHTEDARKQDPPNSIPRRNFHAQT